MCNNYSKEFIKTMHSIEQNVRLEVLLPIKKDIETGSSLSDSERIIADSFVTLRINYQKSKQFLVDNDPGMTSVTEALDVFRNFEHELKY